MGWWYAGFAAAVSFLSNLVLFPDPYIIGQSTVCAFIAARLGSAISSYFGRKPSGMVACFHTWWLFGFLWPTATLGIHIAQGIRLPQVNFLFGASDNVLALAADFVAYGATLPLLLGAPACIVGTLLFNAILGFVRHPRTA